MHGRGTGERGDSLIELLASLAVLSIGVTALLTSLATHASTTVVNRSQSQSNTTLLAAAEHVKKMPYAACSAFATGTLTAGTVPHDETVFTVTYGPGRALTGTPCSELTVVPVRVVGDGFDLTVDVVKRP